MSRDKYSKKSSAPQKYADGGVILNDADKATTGGVGLWDRLKAGNIDQAGSEAHRRWGAGAEELKTASSEALDFDRRERNRELPTAAPASSPAGAVSRSADPYPTPEADNPDSSPAAAPPAAAKPATAAKSAPTRRAAAPVKASGGGFAGGMAQGLQTGAAIKDAKAAAKPADKPAPAVADAAPASEPAASKPAEPAATPAKTTGRKQAPFSETTGKALRNAASKVGEFIQAGVNNSMAGRAKQVVDAGVSAVKEKAEPNRRTTGKPSPYDSPERRAMLIRNENQDKAGRAGVQMADGGMVGCGGRKGYGKK
jgi:hypothetical protein